MSNITVNVNTTNTGSVAATPTVKVVDESVRALAMARFQAEEDAKRQAAADALKKEQYKASEVGAYVLEEQVRMRVQEEQIRRMAERAVLEAEAKRLALAKEAAVEVEMERLRNRSKTEVLEDTVAELKAHLASINAVRQDRS